MNKIRLEPREKKTAIKNSVGRIILAVLMLLVQFIWVWVLVTKLTTQYPVINIVISVFAVILVIAINENEKIMSLKAPTMILIMMAPVIGVLFFLLSDVQHGHDEAPIRELQAPDRALYPPVGKSRQRDSVDR